MVKKISILILTILVLCGKTNGQPIYRVHDHRADSAAFVLNIDKWNTYLNTGKYDSALFYAKKMVGISQDEWGEVTIGTASTYFYVGLTYEDLNDFTLAYHFYKLSINRFEASNIININDNFSFNIYRTTLLHFGILCNNLGAYSEAETAFSKCIPLTKRPALIDVGMNIQALVNFAVTYSSLGEYYKARFLYDSAKQITDTLTRDNSWVYYMKMSIYNNLADIYSQTGNPKKALEFVKKAEEVFKATKLQNEYGGFYFPDYITLLINVADGYKNLHYNDSALLKCNEAEDSLKNKRDDLSKANILQEKASIYIAQKKFAKAMQLCQQSLRIMDTLPERPYFYDATLLNLAALYQQKEEYANADSIYRKEITYLYNKGLTASYNLQEALMGLCQNLLYQHKNKEAADSLLKAGNLAMHVLTENFAGMPESDKIQYTAAFDGIFDMLNSLLANNKNIGSNIKKLAFALQLQRKNMVLANQASLLSRLRQANDTALTNVYTAWLNAKQMLAKQYSLPYSDRFLNTDSLEQLGDELEKQVSEKGYATGITGQNNTIDKFLQQDKNTANIEFIRYNNITKATGISNAEYGAFIIKGGDSIPAFVPLCSEAALMQLMQDKSSYPVDEAQLTQKLYSPSTVEATMLYTLIWKPLDKYLQGVSVINYSPAGLLNNISFHALYNGKNWLATNYAMHCFSSLADVANTQTAAAPPKQISLWGNMDYDSSNYNIDTVHNNAEGETNTGSIYAEGIKPAQQLKSISKAPLPNFYTDELSAIKKVFIASNINCTGYENTTATEENFKQHSPNIQGVLHISTHGFYTPYNKKDADAQLPGSFIAGNTNPLFRCGLAFAGVNYYWMKGQPKPNHDDGILTGYEVSQLGLHNVQLVTLSACETGLGDITATEGNLGLQRAFKLAGVQKLLVSLWQVPAKQTQQLLTKFYTYWLAGSTPARALQAAETDMQKAHYPPYYWAGFVLVE